MALLLVSAAVNGQPGSDFERFQLYNACRPMGLRGHSGASANAGALVHEDGINLRPFLDVAKSRLRAERLYSLLESESNGAFLTVSINVRSISPEIAAYDLSLKYHKFATDSGSGLEHPAATWTTSTIECCDTLDSDTISRIFTSHVDLFLEEYSRVNEEDCRPPSLTATGLISCAGAWDGAECWMGLSNVPGCYVWNDLLLPDQTVTWTGECAGELAQGKGTLKWVWDRGRGQETAEETGHLQAGKKRHGQWIRRSGNGTVHEGPYVEGKPHGNWVIRHKSGKREVVTYENGKRWSRSAC